MSEVNQIKEYLEWRGIHEGRERDVSPEEWDHQQAVKEVVLQAGVAYAAINDDLPFDTEDLRYALEWYWKTVPNEDASGAITGNPESPISGKDERHE